MQAAADRIDTGRAIGIRLCLFNTRGVACLNDVHSRQLSPGPPLRPREIRAFGAEGQSLTSLRCRSAFDDCCAGQEQFSSKDKQFIFNMSMAVV